MRKMAVRGDVRKMCKSSCNHIRARFLRLDLTMLSRTIQRKVYQYSIRIEEIDKP